jgi:LacI family transcriptional regulator
MTKQDNTAASLREIARLANAHVSTVSRVLRNDSSQRVSHQTRERIHSIAKDLGYSPNIHARSLRSKKSHEICILFPQIDNPAFIPMVEGASSACRARGYFPYIYFTSKDEPIESALAELQGMNHFGGFLAVTFDNNEILLKTSRAIGKNLVLLNTRAEGGDVNCVWLNTCKAMFMLTEHLLAQGHRNIGYISGERGGFNAEERFRGFLDAHDQYGIQPHEEVVCHAGYDYAVGEDSMRRILASGVPCSAVIVSMLTCAAGAYSVLQRNNLVVGRDIAMATLHRGVLTDALALTHVRLPTFEVGFEGTNALLDIIEEKRGHVQTQLEPLELVIRKSTGSRYEAKQQRGLT